MIIVGSVLRRTILTDKTKIGKKISTLGVTYTLGITVGKKATSKLALITIIFSTLVSGSNVAGDEAISLPISIFDA